MNEQLKYTIVMAGVFLALFGLGELLHHRFRVKAEFTRKFVHAGTGLLTMFFPVLFSSVWPVFFLCSSFALILFLSLRYNLLKSINAVGRDSFGSITYPVSVLICFLFFLVFECSDKGGPNYASFYLPVLILAFADPAAALFGKKWPLGPYKVGQETKSLLGSAVFFCVAFLVGFLVLEFTDVCLQEGLWLPCVLSISFTAAITEALSRKGLDNLFIPCTVIVTYDIFYHLQL